MNRRLAVTSIILLLVGAGIGYGTSSLIDDDGSSANDCQAAVDYFRAIDSFIGDRAGAISALLKDSDTTLVEQWRVAFENMRKQCADLR